MYLASNLLQHRIGIGLPILLINPAEIIQINQQKHPLLIRILKKPFQNPFSCCISRIQLGQIILFLCTALRQI